MYLHVLCELLVIVDKVVTTHSGHIVPRQQEVERGGFSTNELSNKLAITSKLLIQNKSMRMHHIRMVNACACINQTGYVYLYYVHNSCVWGPWG